MAALAQALGAARREVDTPLGVRPPHTVILLTTLMLATPGGFITLGAAPGRAPMVPEPSLSAAPATAAPAATVPASPTTVPLSHLTPVSVVNGYGPISLDHSTAAPPPATAGSSPSMVTATATGWASRLTPG